jgi:hypothetical protein
VIKPNPSSSSLVFKPRGLVTKSLQHSAVKTSK